MTGHDAQAAIEALRSSGFVVMMESSEPDAEGSLIFAAQFVSPDSLREFSSRAMGPLYICLTDARCAELGLASDPSSDGPWQPGSIALRGLASASSSRDDHARTIQALLDPNRGPDDFERIGYVHPLRARPGGVLQRSGQTEAAVDLARLAGLAPAGVVCEIMNEDGTMARVKDLVGYCDLHGLKMVTVADLIEYRRKHENLVKRVASVRLPTAVGLFRAVAYEEVLTGKHHVALVKGDVDGAEDVLVRVHSECLTGDVFHSQRCDCGEQLDWALRRIEAEGLGVVLYLAQEGRGIGLLNKLRAYELQEQGFDTVEANLRLGFAADAREYGIGSQILADLGLTTIRVLTNNPKKISGISGFGLSVVSQEPIEIAPNPENREYLESKRDKMGHTIELHESHQRVRFDPESA